MTQHLVRLAGYLVVPSGFLLGAAMVAPELATMPRSQMAFMPYLPLLVLGLGLGLSWRFNQSRVFFTLTVLLLAYWGLREGLPHGLGHAVRQRAIYNVVGMLLPLSLVAMCVLRERGIFTVHGLVRFVALLIPATIAAVLIGWPRVDLSPLPAELLAVGRFGWTPLPALVIGAYALGFALLFVRLAWRHTAVDSAMLGALGATAMVLQTGAPMINTAVFVTAGGLLLLVGVLQEGYRKAYVDELTGLPGRRALDEELLKLSGQYAVAMVDVDRFKKFNDTYGHEVGDQVLRMIATRLGRVTGGGRPFRYGGEEFTILFSGKTAREAGEHLDRLRQHIAQSPFAVRTGHRNRARSTQRPRGNRGQRPTVTVSMGVAERNARQATPDKVIRAADRALYRAKQAGRNRVCY